MTSVARWLDDTASRQPPDSLPHPGDEFPLRTFSNPPSDTTFSDTDTDDGLVATLVHPPTPVTMEQSTRRRSSSITGTAATAATRKEPRKHPRRDDHIAEEGEHSDNASDSASRSDSTDLELDDMSADGLDDDEETGLTKKVRRKNARRKRRNTLLDQRVVPDVAFTREEKKLADESLMRDMLVNASLICLW